MYDHSADILGNEHLLTRPPPSRFTSQRLVVYAVCLGAAYLVAHTAWRRVLEWRERSSRLAMRRRHGIPDDDLRPFNVAYADAMNQRTDEEKKRTRPNPARAPALAPQREAELEQNLRQRAGRPPVTDSRGHTPTAATRSNSSAYNNVPVNSSKTYSEDYNPRRPGQFAQAPVMNKGLARDRGYINVQDANATVEDGKKRALDQVTDFDSSHEAKKSRINGVALQPTEDASTLQRGEKRGLGDDDEVEDVTPTRESRGKRARQFSQQTLQPQDGDQSMDVDDQEAAEEEDEITELRSPLRGKKRDRAEAGSTFGGDDDDEHVQVEDEKDRRRRRKRRTVAKRMSEASFARGKKRDAEDDEEEVSDEDGVGSPERHRRKSRRQTLRDSRSMNSDISMSDSTRSRQREIGEEWEMNGVKYKIGPNCDKLRQALVKKARQKFVMPQDSQHPDRDTNLEVYVECWLTEDEYAEAKKQHRLAWQDSPGREVPEKLTLTTASIQSLPPPPQPSGKTLLWAASSSATNTPVGSPASSVEPPDAFGRLGRRRDPFRDSIVNQPLSPFTVPSSLPSARRIASTSQANYEMYASTVKPPVSPGASSVTSFPGSPVLGESSIGSPRYRTYSKWEKQELEANAMMRVRAANAKKEEEANRLKAEQERQLRERLEREKAEKEQREKAEKEKKEKEAAAAAAAKPASAGAVPSITVTPPAASGTAPASGGFSFGPAAASAGASTAPKNLFAMPSSASTPAAPAAPAASAAEPPKFSFGSAPTTGAAPKPAGDFSFGPAAPAATTAEPSKDAAAGGESLLSRLGPQPAADASKPPAVSPFGVPKVENAANPFGKAAASSAATAPANPAPAAPPSGSETAAPKFSFAGFNKPAGAPAVSAFGAPATNSSSSSLNGALGTAPEAKPAAPTFSFKVPGAPASATANGGAAAASQPGVNPTAPKFSFGPAATSSAPSPFGATASTTAATEPAKDTAPKFSFGAPASSSTPSAFGTNGASATPAAAAAEPAKDAPAPVKSTFSFGTPAASSTTTTGAAAPSPFGAAATPSPFGGAAAAANPSPFGGAGSTTSAFGKPAGGATSAFGTTGGSAASGSVFGATSNPGASNPFGTAKSAFGATPAAATSAFGATPSNAPAGDKPAEAPKPMFSFASSAAPAAAASTAAKPGFSFGSTGAATPAAGATTGTAAPAAAAPAAGGFSFNFGGAPAGGAAAAKPSPFGAPAAGAAANPFAAAASGAGAFGSTGTGAFSFGKK